MRRGIARGHGRRDRGPGRRPRVQPRGVPGAARPDREGQGGRGLRQPLHRPPPLLPVHALPGQPVPEPGHERPLQHDHDGHGDLLQGRARRPPEGAPPAAATASASSPRSRPSSSSAGPASTRCPSPTRAATTPRARRSPGRTASRPSGRWSSTGSSTDERRARHGSRMVLLAAPSTPLYLPVRSVDSLKRVVARRSSVIALPAIPVRDASSARAPARTAREPGRRSSRSVRGLSSGREASRSSAGSSPTRGPTAAALLRPGWPPRATPPPGPVLVSHGQADLRRGPDPGRQRRAGRAHHPRPLPASRASAPTSPRRSWPPWGSGRSPTCATRSTSTSSASPSRSWAATARAR